MKFILFLIVLIALVSTSDYENQLFQYPNGSPVSLHGKLKVQGVQLVSSTGQPVQLRGLSTHGPQWFENCYSYESFAELANNWKVDVIRIAMYVNEQGYNTKPDYWRQKIDQYVDWIGQLGMYALIDWHILTPGNPNDQSYNGASEFWKYMSKKHGTKAHVLYEICNEPNGVAWSEIERYAKNIIPQIRAIDPSTVIVVGTPQWSSDLYNMQPLSYSNLMYTLHFYASSHKFYDGLKERAQKLPLFVTEYGTCSATGGGNLDLNEAEKWVKFFNGDNQGNQKISFINWSYSDANESCAALNQGACNGHSWNNLQQSGQWVKSKMQEKH